MLCHASAMFTSGHFATSDYSSNDSLPTGLRDDETSKVFRLYKI